ncbi:MAG: damage-inducible protein DinB [Betaproteobacteria bacterium]|nr:damage-inducible protein DinB [Betaproteobacteria bacterium]
MDTLMLISALKYKQWADQRTLAAVEVIDGENSPSAIAFALQQLNHMVRVEELFRARLLGVSPPHTSTNTEVVPGLQELSQRITDSDKWFTKYGETLPPNQLTESVYFDFVDGKRGAMTRQEILFHIINHGTYHRGAIGHALDLARALRPADTYTVFIHSVEPERRQQT